MPGRTTALALLLAGVVAVPAACAEDTTGRFCDVLKRLEASADPLDDRVLQDPARLRAALADLVDTYQELDRTAPESMRADTRVLADAYRGLDSLFARANYASATVNDSAAFKELTGQAFRSATASVARFGVRSCAIKISGRPAP